jgi:hypothetical protein
MTSPMRNSEQRRNGARRLCRVMLAAVSICAFSALRGQAQSGTATDASLAARISALEARVAALEAQANNNNNAVKNTVTAPFQVNDSTGKPILKVDATNGLTVTGPDGGSIMIGPGKGSAHQTAVRAYPSGSATPVAGFGWINQGGDIWVGGASGSGAMASMTYDGTTAHIGPFLPGKTVYAAELTSANNAGAVHVNDAAGKPVINVDAATGETVTGPDGGSIVIGPGKGSSHQTAVRAYPPGAASPVAGMGWLNQGGDMWVGGASGSGAMASMTYDGNMAHIGAFLPGTTVYAVELTRSTANGGAVQIRNGSQVMVGNLTTTTNGATLTLQDSEGQSFESGIGGTDGNAFASVTSKKGVAFLGSPNGKDFGVRLYAPDGSTPTAGLVEDGGGNASMGIGKGQYRVKLQSSDTVGTMGVLGNDGQTFVSALTNYAGGGGALQVANGSGQIVSLVDSNPTTTEGRAVFTDSGGQPLAKIGVAGSHGEVLLFGGSKAVAVWEFMLTGFH